MPSRRILGAAALAATCLILTSCKTDGSAASATTTAPATAQPAVSTAASASPSDSGLAVDPEPSSDCPAGKLPAGHKMVQVTTPPSGATMQARAAIFSCDPNGGGYAGQGAATSYPLATGAVAQLNAGSTAQRTVTLSALTQHISACLQHAAVPAPFSCSGNIYDIAVSSSGSVTGISEVWHS